jgi:hypothetical protein
MNRFVVMVGMVGIALAACVAPVDDTSETAPAGIIPAEPCNRCTNWLVAPGFVDVGGMCEASDYFAKQVVACGSLLGDCPDINLSRPPNEECMNQLHAECYVEIVNCEQDLDLP